MTSANRKARVERRFRSAVDLLDKLIEQEMEQVTAQAKDMKIGLNLGCGTRIFREHMGIGEPFEILWYNMDIHDGPGVDVVDDWRNLTQHWQNDIDIIVAHQTWEHAGCGEQPIRQCYDVLKPGGSLIVSVPDLRKLAQMWLRGELSTQIYMTNVYGPYDGTVASRHFWGFDSESLVDQLQREAPWSRISDFDYREIPGADIARDDRWILCLEAIK